MKKIIRLVLCGILVLGLGLSAGWSALVIDSAAVNPASAPVGVATLVTVTAVITEPTVIVNSVNLQRLDTAGRVIAVIGNLHDDGLDGDLAVGDKTFTIRITLFETALGPVTMRVSAAFQGSLLRPFSNPLTVNVTGASATGITINRPRLWPT